jgi:DNA-binding protein Fis
MLYSCQSCDFVFRWRNVKILGREEVRIAALERPVLEIVTRVLDHPQPSIDDFFGLRREMLELRIAKYDD